ncbi:MAG: PEP-CTERM sorting domain-containing protein [Rhodospirillales bacterium]|nr:PEP-CTERM sorting domain-containing protein [Rhodospirillales bacterium]
MNFSVLYDGSRLGGVGSGAFTFDAEAGQLSNFTFRFGEVTGALPDQDLSFPILGGSAASFIFEILSGADAHPEGCGSSVNCGANLIAIGELVRFVMFNRTVDAPLASYEFRDAITRTAVFAGLLTVQQVPEPAGLALLGLGVLGVTLMRRHRQRNYFAPRPSGFQPTLE